MPLSPFDSAIFADLLGDAEVQRLFSDSAQIRAMLIVEGALARAQGELGVIPELSGAFLHRACLEVQIDPAALAAETGQSAVPVPALVKAVRRALDAPEHAQWLHFGATSQDILDTALMLRLRQVTAILRGRLDTLLGILADLAERHAEQPMLARTYGQAAVPTSFGATVAAWGAPILRHRARLDAAQPRLQVVSLSGAAGTLAAMGPRGPEVRERMAGHLRLADPGESWHTARDRVAELAAWAAALTASLGKLGEDVGLMAQSGREEIVLAAGGGSSTMPQKRNPVAAATLVALARFSIALDGAMQGAALAREARDGAAWITEWLALPQILAAAGRALLTASDLCGTMSPAPDRMARALEAGGRLWAAEALVFALARDMPRPEAEAEVRALVAKAQAEAADLPALAAARFGDRAPPEAFLPAALLGEAPTIARRFVRAVRAAA